MEEAQLAATNGIFLEISTRKGHCLTNGLVASLARQAGASLLLDSDAHSAHDLLTTSLTTAVAHGAGLDDTACKQMLSLNPRALLKSLTSKYQD